MTADRDFESTLDLVVASLAGLIESDRSRVIPPEEPLDGASMAVKSASLREALERLAGSENLDETGVNEFVEYFETLYKRDERGRHFRHMYSDACDVMYSFFDRAQRFDRGVPYEVIVLESNMSQIVDRFRESKPSAKELSSVVKLQDHIHLEFVRMRHQESMNSEFRERMDSLGDSIAGAQKDLDDNLAKTKKKLRLMRRSVDSMQRQYITILGILAAVVLAFNGGMTFSASSISAVYGYHPLRIALIVFVVGFVLFNLLAALFTFLLMSTRVKESGEPLSPSEVWGKGCRRAFFWTNAVLGLGVIVTFALVACAYGV